MWIDEKFFLIKKKLKKYEDKNLKIIDLGARNQILKKFIPRNFLYTGVDKFKNDNDNIIIDLDKEFNNLVNNKYDIVFALDIIEHTDDPYNFIKKCMELSKNLIYLVIPNAAYYSFRINFLIKGEITNKFHFSGKSNDDRHKWLTNFRNTKKFLTQFQNNGYDIKIEKILKNRNKLKFLYYFEQLLSKFLPSLFSWSFLVTFEKKNVD